MLEREFEILIRICANEIFPTGWKLIAQQLSLPSGRLDMLYADSSEIRHVIELKKGTAKTDSVDQSIRYANDLKNELKDNNVIPWVVAHEIPKKVYDHAQMCGAKAIEITTHMRHELITKNNIKESDLLGTRRAKGVLHGGSAKGGLRNVTENRVVFMALSPEVASVLRSLEKDEDYRIQSGGMQTVIHTEELK